MKEENIADDGYIIDLSYGPTWKEIEDVLKELREITKDGLEKFNPAKRISIIYLIAGCGYSEYNMQMLVCNEYDKTNEGYKMVQIEQSMKFLAD